MSSIPLQPDCDMESPEEHVLWALINLPGPDGIAPMLVPPEVLRQWSARLYAAGFRHHADKQEIRFDPPPGDHNWLMGGAGQWVDVDAPAPESASLDLDSLSQQDKVAIFEALKSELPVDDGDVASVSEVEDDSAE